MILYNKLVRTDLALMVAVILLAFFRNDPVKSLLMGLLFGIFIISLVNHISHYRKYKKLY
jgi:hypothetical protein